MTNPLEQRARDVLADELDRAGDHEAARGVRNGSIELAAMASLRAMQAYADQRVKEALAAAANVAREKYRGHGHSMRTARAYNYEHAGKSIAAAIESLPTGEKP